jgi:hypothetical protein
MTLGFCKIQIDGALLIFEMIRPDGTVGDFMIVEEPVRVTFVEKLPVIWGKIKAGAQ